MISDTWPAHSGLMSVLANCMAAQATMGPPRVPATLATTVLPALVGMVVTP
jgi:hypothetical protein